MAQCPKCGSNTAEFRREYKHGEYVTVGFCTSCGYTWQSENERDKELEKISQFKQQMSSVKNDFVIVNKPSMPVNNLTAKAICGLIIAIGLGGAFGLVGINLLISTLPLALEYGTSIDGIGYTVVGIIAAVVGMILYCQGKAEGKITKQHNMKYNDELLKQKEISRNRIENAYKNSNQIIPFVYADPRMVDILELYILNKQVSSIGESINKFEADQRYQQQMQMQFSQLMAMREQAQAQRDCANAQNRTASNISNINDAIRNSNLRF